MKNAFSYSPGPLPPLEGQPEKLLGTYGMGDHNVRVYYVEEGDGGRFQYRPDDGGTLKLIIGFHVDAWSDVLDHLLHETFEALYILLYCAHQPLCPNTRSSSNRTFVLCHEQFSEACAQAAPFLSYVQPDLARAYYAYRRKRVAAERKKNQKSARRKKRLAS